MTERPLSARQVAQRCGVELKTVHNWVASGLLPHFRTPGRHLRFVEKDVERFLATHGARQRSKGEVLLIGGPSRGTPRRWRRVADPLEGLCRAGAEQPAAIVLRARHLGGLEPRRVVRALALAVPGSRIVWIGPRAPTGPARGLLRVESVEQAVALLEELHHGPR